MTPPSTAPARPAAPAAEAPRPAPPPRADWSRVEPGEHIVQYYQDDVYLLDSLRGYVGAGLKLGEAVVVIMTPEHLRGLELRLGAEGVDVRAAKAAGLFTALDAATTLSKFMLGGMPDPSLFAATIGPVLKSAGAAGHPGRPVRAFGEMVAILWEAGNEPAAIRLEELWNDLATVHSFALLCAYRMACFGGHEHSRGFDEVCRSHSRVIPADGLGAHPETDARAREIAVLQQKAAALEGELALRRAADRELTEFLDNAIEGVHRVGPDGTVLWANRAELDMLGYDRDEYVGRPIRQFHADQPVIEDILARLLRGETVYNRPARLIARDGSVVHALIHANGRWEGGEFRYSRCFTRDVTAEKRAQDERDAMLAREQAVRRELELANADLRDFGHIISHDLREPLRGISNFASFLASDHAPQLDDAAQEKIRTIQRLTRRSYDLLDAVMAVSRVGREELEVADTDAASIIARALDSLRARIDEEGARVTQEPCGARVRCDPRLASQALVNLMANGLKYNESDPKTLRVGCDNPLGEQPVFFVQDNGIGIDPRHHQKVFQMFKRLHHAEAFGGGTGAGLAIVRKIVERHGGRAWVESRPGLGATFFFTLGPDPGAPASRSAVAPGMR